MGMKMKGFYFSTILLFSGMLNVSCDSSSGESNSHSTVIELFDSLDYQMHYEEISQPEGGYVPNALVAINLAEIIFNSVYDESSISGKKPFLAKYDDSQKVWLVHGTLPPGEDGGVPYILIQQKDGKILSVWHDK